jgi:hypothetical protein
MMDAKKQEDLDLNPPVWIDRIDLSHLSTQTTIEKTILSIEIHWR